MKTLLAAIYRKYSTTLLPGWDGLSPVVASRFELVRDDIVPPSVFGQDKDKTMIQWAKRV